MKKILGLLSCLLMLTSCDDGNVTSTGFNFDPAAPIVSCNSKNDGLYYKTHGVEALILQTPSTMFDTVVTQGKPRTVVIDNSSTLVVYRTFNAAVTDTYFCSAFPPSSPVVTSESIASSGGYLEITTTAAKTDTITHKITSYNHNVVFRNITFANSKSSFVYSSYVFGNYVTTRTP